MNLEKLKAYTEIMLLPSKKIYLAGPDVFFPDSNKISERLKKECEDFGFVGMYPMDNDVDINSPNIAAQICGANMSMIHACDAVIANISPFRGPHMDVGTAFEIGYARALGKPVFMYSDDNRTLIERIPWFFDKKTNMAKDLSGYMIEDFGLIENLMITPSKDHPVQRTSFLAVQYASLFFKTQEGTYLETDQSN